MTDDDVLKLARDCGIHVPTVLHSCITNKEELIAFAAAVEQATISAIIIARSSVAGNSLNIRPEDGEIQVITLSQDYVIGD